jgi:putative transposase
MKASQFSDEQIVQILQQAERDEQTIGAICHSHGIAEATFYRWRKKFGGMTQNEIQRLRELEKENSRLNACSPSAIWRLMRSRSCSRKNADHGREARGSAVPAHAPSL